MNEDLHSDDLAPVKATVSVGMPTLYVSYEVRVHFVAVSRQRNDGKHSAIASSAARFIFSLGRGQHVFAFPPSTHRR